MNTSPVPVVRRLLSVASALVSISLCSGCNRSPASEPPPPIAAAPAPLATQSAVPTASIVPTTVAPTAGRVESPLKREPSALSVKRFVVGSGVEDREPVVSAEPLVSDGTPIYAFAEVANPNGDSENVRITFERRGGQEKVGDVSLPIPGKVARHRTWAFTRFIRAPGVWEAVLWSESGRELSRTRFEVTAS